MGFNSGFKGLITLNILTSVLDISFLPLCFALLLSVIPYTNTAIDFYEHFVELRTRNPPARCYIIVTINYSACMGEDWQSELQLSRRKRPTTTWLLR